MTSGEGDIDAAFAAADRTVKQRILHKRLAPIAMIVTGLLLGIVGTDVNSGTQRFAFGIPELSDGIGFVIVAMGMFGTAEIIGNLDLKDKREVFNYIYGWLRQLPTEEKLRQVVR